MPEEDGICVKFDMLTGNQWHLHAGNETGISQHAYKSMHTNDRVIWNFPFEMVYRHNDIAGWPRISVTLTSRDFWGRDVICGYGVVHAPTQPGSHTRYMQIFKPRASTWFGQFLGWV